jgi:hypothetical protein
MINTTVGLSQEIVLLSVYHKDQERAKLKTGFPSIQYFRQASRTSGIYKLDKTLQQ